MIFMCYLHIDITIYLSAKVPAQRKSDRAHCIIGIKVFLLFSTTFCSMYVVSAYLNPILSAVNYPFYTKFLFHACMTFYLTLPSHYFIEMKWIDIPKETFTGMSSSVSNLLCSYMRLLKYSFCSNMLHLAATFEQPNHMI